jgi:hypothetical protein
LCGRMFDRQGSNGIRASGLSGKILDRASSRRYAIPRPDFW